MPEYEIYIKHSPLSLETHRKELKQNHAYEVFIQKCSQDPRIQKRDIKTFLSRPVTRLPRLRLLLERIEKTTDAEHPDLDILPLLMTVLGDFIKSTEPGILAAESKVKFWNLCESLSYSRGEIIVCTSPPMFVNDIPILFRTWIFMATTAL
jgi:RHO1 GDP-GTP exchange protein 1/2